uniref:Calcitonin peptide-like domain-containing protein n=1 Tax=Podarcis muralis TaxID=64176 RepID=A0A670HMF2_PODMU
MSLGSPQAGSEGIFLTPLLSQQMAFVPLFQYAMICLLAEFQGTKAASLYSFAFSRILLIKRGVVERCALFLRSEFFLLENSVTTQKRACNTATCVTHRLADFLSRSGGVGKNNFVPTNVGSKGFGRRRRNVQM